MHYKNGRPAQNGDKVLLKPSYGAPVVGILYDAVAGNNSCNGRLAPCSPNDPTPNLAECVHIDDVAVVEFTPTELAPSPVPQTIGGEPNQTSKP